LSGTTSTWRPDHPALTTISQIGVEMGRVAVELLFRMVDQNLNLEEVSDVLLDPMLVVRQSTALPPVGAGSRPWAGLT
jgi:DNA-binding LacI/PurR family transcriptional regulator